MTGHQAEPGLSQAVAKEHVAGLFGVAALKTRAKRKSANLLQGPADSSRVARELNRGGIGEEFALPGHGAFDQSSKEHADAANGHQGEAKQRKRIAALAPAAGAETIIIMPVP